MRKDVLKLWDLTAPELVLLDLAASALDRVTELEAVIAADGLMVKGSTGQPVLHPAVAEARQAAWAFTRLLGVLSLPDEREDGGAVASWASARASKAAASRWSGYTRNADLGKA